MRKQNWVIELNKFLEGNRHRPFKRGDHDCALFAANCINVMREGKEDIGKEFRIDYKNKKQALDLLKEKGYKNLEDVAQDKLKNQYPSPVYAKRGDCVSVECPEGIALAIVDLTGRRAVTTGKNGLEYYPMDQWLKAWEV